MLLWTSSVALSRTNHCSDSRGAWQLRGIGKKMFCCSLRSVNYIVCNIYITQAREGSVHEARTKAKCSHLNGGVLVMGWVLWELRPLFLFFFLSLSFFVNSHALGYASSVLLVSCAFHFSFCIRLESCVPSFSVMTAEIPASQALWCTYTSHALHSPPSYKKVCATRMLREKCTGCQDLRLASNRAQLYTCVYFFFFACWMYLRGACTYETR